MTHPFESNDINANAPVGESANTVTPSATPNPQKIIQDLREKVSDLPPEKHDEVHSIIDELEEMVEKGPKSLRSVELLITSLFTYFPSAVPWLTAQAQQIARILGG